MSRPRLMHLAVMSLLVGIASLALPIVAAGASSVTTNWTGGGTPVGGAYPWTDPANWDNGVPSAGAIVTIDPTTSTGISDVPDVQLSELHLTADGSIGLRLDTSEPLAEIDVSGVFEWRSGTIGPLVWIDAKRTATTTILGSTDTGDAAVLEGDLWIEGAGEIGAFGTPPTGSSDATFRIGPNTPGEFIGLLDINGSSGTRIDDGTVIASVDPADPGLVVTPGGNVAAIGPAAGQLPSGVRILELGVLVTAGSASTFETRVAPGGSQMGQLIFRHDDMSIGVLYLKGGSTIVFGSGTSVHGSEDIWLFNGTSVQIGEGGDAAPVVWQGAGLLPFGGVAHATWLNATLEGPLRFQVDVFVADGDDTTPAAHELSGGLSINGARSLYVQGDMTIDAGASVTVDAIHVAAQPRLTLSGDPSVTLAARELDFDAPSGTTLEIDGITTSVDFSMDLKANRIFLGQDTSLTGAFLRINETIAGSDPGTTLGAIMGVPGTTGQVLSGTWGVTPQLDAAFSPTRRQSFDVISVPGGSWTGALLLYGPSDPWEIRSDPTSSSLIYVFVSNILANAKAPAIMERGTRAHAVITVVDTGPVDGGHVHFLARLPLGLRVVRVVVDGIACVHGGHSVHCDLGGMPALSSIKVRMMLEAERIGDHIVWIRVHDPMTHNSNPGSGRPRFAIQVT